MVVILIMVLMKGEIDWVPICSFEVHLYDYYQNPTHMKVLSAFLWSLNHHSKATIRQKVHSAKKRKKKKKNTKSAQHQTIHPCWTEGTLCSSASACACAVHAWIHTCIELYCTSCRCVFFISSIGLNNLQVSFSQPSRKPDGCWAQCRTFSHD